MSELPSKKKAKYWLKSKRMQQGQAHASIIQGREFSNPHQLKLKNLRGIHLYFKSLNEINKTLLRTFIGTFNKALPKWLFCCSVHSVEYIIMSRR